MSAMATQFRFLNIRKESSSGQLQILSSPVACVATLKATFLSPLTEIEKSLNIRTVVRARWRRYKTTNMSPTAAPLMGLLETLRLQIFRGSTRRRVTSRFTRTRKALRRFIPLPISRILTFAPTTLAVIYSLTGLTKVRWDWLRWEKGAALLAPLL